MSFSKVVELSKTPVLVIVGPTSSGKSSLAVKIAKKYNGEIISADSRAIYKYVDIASAKPTEKEQSGIIHWGLDIVGPSDFENMNDNNFTSPFTVADFKKYAEEKILEISTRGNLPIVVGGSGLYIDALIYGYKFNKSSSGGEKKTSINVRKIYHDMSIQELQDYCKNNNIILPSNFNNKRYLVRAIEKSLRGESVENNRKQIDPRYKVVGITTNKEELDIKIAQRIDQMLGNGLVEEYKNISKIYHEDSEVLKSNAYIVIKKYLNKEIKSNELKSELIKLDRKLVKKQKTWFKRNEQIMWTNLDEAPHKIGEILKPYDR